MKEKRRSAWNDPDEPEVIEPPYFSMLKGRWVGTPPPRKSPDNPPCPWCGTNEKVEIFMHRHIDSDGYFHETTYICWKCGRVFSVEK